MLSPALGGAAGPPSSLSDTPYRGYMGEAPHWQGDKSYPGKKKGPAGVL